MDKNLFKIKGDAMRFFSSYAEIASWHLISFNSYKGCAYMVFLQPKKDEMGILSYEYSNQLKQWIVHKNAGYIFRVKDKRNTEIINLVKKYLMQFDVFSFLCDNQESRSKRYENLNGNVIFKQTDSVSEKINLKFP